MSINAIPCHSCGRLVASNDLEDDCCPICRRSRPERTQEVTD